MARCPREGGRVKFNPYAGAMSLYTPGTHPSRGESGSITTVSLGSRRATCIPGPRGGLVYVKWDKFGTTGVFKTDLLFGLPSRKRR
jgi:hypothetical protein